VTTCPNCGRESSAEFQFCPFCGHALAEATGPQTERRVVTVLFCDLVGFTARSDQADPEDVRAILAPFHGLAKSEIERFGGTLDKFIGDAAMGVFGSPLSHEDDPERAVRAAMAILSGVAALNEERRGEPLAVRIGVNTGEAVVTLAAGVQVGENVAGDVVNTAARLQTAAPAGGVIVGQTTYEATGNAVTYEPLDAVRAKGKAEALPVWRATSIRSLPTISDRAATTPFVGRDRERALLEQAFLETLAGPAVRLVTVVGEPGAGKSRLVAELLAALPRLTPDAAVQWRRGRCLPYGEGITFWALGEIVKDLAGILDSDPPGERDRKVAAVLDRLFADTGDRAWLRARLAPLAGGEPAGVVDRDEAFAAWQRFLEAVARDRPLIAVFEDLHWADPAMLSFIEFVAGRGSRVPLLFVGTARPELYDRYPTWTEGLEAALTVSLAPLSDEETATLVSSLLDSPAIPAGTRNLLLERSGGNPLYAEEFARTLLDRGLVQRGSGLAGDIADIEFPPTVQALIAARLDTLSRGRKGTLLDASVIGRVFWSGAVAFIGEADEPRIAGDLAELDRREFVRAAPASSIRDQREFSFWHAVVRDVAYAQIPRAARATKHRRAAAWTEAIAGERVGDVAEILAHHAISALELARASGLSEELEDLERDAARYLRLAAVRTMALDVAKAEQQLLRALELTPPGHPDRPGVMASLAEAAFQGGRLDEADRRFDEAITGLRESGDQRAAADAMVRRSVVLEYRGEVAAGRVLLSDAVTLLEGLPPGPELARALATSAGSLMVSGHYQEAIREADRALGLARTAHEPGAEARAHGFRGYSRAIQGDPEGLEEQRAALAGLRTAGQGRATAVAYNNLGSCLLHMEGSRPALDTLREGVAFAETRGLRESVMALEDSMLTVLFEAGEWDDLLRLGTKVVEEARRQGSGHDEVYAEADRAMVLAYREGAAVAALCESVLERARPLIDAPLVSLALVAAGLARQASGDHAGAAALVREALDATAGESIVDRAGHLPELGRLAVAAGDVALAEQVLEGTETLVLERYRLAATTVQAMIAEARGETEQALRSYRQAAQEWERWGNALERAHALFGQGRCLSALGRMEEARAALTAAGSAFGGLGSVGKQTEVKAFLG
jgi:class 3 adenylate cyclase/tetratricopeptide (TPR) repeat protein